MTKPSSGPITAVGGLVKICGTSGNLDLGAARAMAFGDMLEIIAPDAEHVLGGPRNRRQQLDLGGGIDGARGLP